MATMRAHKIKCWPTPFRALFLGDKTCELRKNDRDYQVGDYLMIVEFDPIKDEMSGRYECRRVTHIVEPGDPPRGLIEGHVILSLETCDKFETNALLGQETSGLIASDVEWLRP